MVFYTLIFKFLDTTQKEKKFKKLNGSRHSLNLICLLFLLRNELEVRKQYQIEITNRFAALGNLIDDKEINRAWENIKTSDKEGLGLHKFKQHKPWFDEECLHFLDQKEAG